MAIPLEKMFVSEATPRRPARRSSVAHPATLFPQEISKRATEENLPEGESSLCTFKRIGNESHEWSTSDSHNRTIVPWSPIHQIF